jgi:hypothetical protein
MYKISINFKLYSLKFFLCMLPWGLEILFVLCIAQQGEVAR